MIEGFFDALQGFFDALQGLLGEDIEDINVWQMLLRAAIVYIGALALIRLGQKRFLGRHTAFDVILGIMLGSVVSRAINSTALIFETLAAAALLVGFHWLIAAIAFHTDRFGPLVKGNVYTLIQDGQVDWDVMEALDLSEKDLMEALRTQGGVTDPSEVRVACLERSGKISVIPRQTAPRVVEVEVEAGVQRVRIELT